MLTEDQKTHFTILSCIYIGTGSFAFIANMVQMIIIGRDKKQRNSVFGLTLLSLSISDIFVSIVLLYRGIFCLLLLLLVVDLNIFYKHFWSADLGIVFSLASSFSHVIFIVLVRILAILFPMRIKRIITKSRCKIILVLLWLFSIGVVTTSYFTIQSKLIAILTIITSVILLLAYSFICYMMCRRHRIQNNDATRRHRQQSDRDVLIYSIVLAFTFCLCCLPAAMSDFVQMPIRVFEVTIFLYSVNSFMDPLLYFFASHCKRRRENNNMQNGNNTNGSCQTIEETTRIWMSTVMGFNSVYRNWVTWLAQQLWVTSTTLLYSASCFIGL